MGKDVEIWGEDPWKSTAVQGPSASSGRGFLFNSSFAPQSAFKVKRQEAKARVILPLTSGLSVPRVTGGSSARLGVLHASFPSWQMF